MDYKKIVQNILMVAGALFLLIIFIGFIQSQISKQPQTTSITTPVPVTIQVPPPTSVPIAPTPAQTNTLIVQHNTEIKEKLTKYILSTGPEFEYPKSGMKFLIVNLKITNKGYALININEFQWDLKVSTKDNPNSFISVDKVFQGEPDGIICKDAALYNNGWTTCKLAFEVPTNYDRYQIEYRKFNDVNIRFEEVDASIRL